MDTLREKVMASRSALHPMSSISTTNERFSTVAVCSLTQGAEGRDRH